LAGQRILFSMSKDIWAGWRAGPTWTEGGAPAPAAVLDTVCETMKRDNEIDASTPLLRYTTTSRFQYASALMQALRAPASIGQVTAVAREAEEVEKQLRVGADRRRRRVGAGGR
jgi:hypothetical protein